MWIQCFGSWVDPNHENQHIFAQYRLVIKENSRQNLEVAENFVFKKKHKHELHAFILFTLWPTNLNGSLLDLSKKALH